jgi:hypothetical protein
MRCRTWLGFVATFIACVLAGVSHADQDQQDRRISSLEAEVGALRAALQNQHQNWLTEQRAAEIKGLVQDVLADADTRSSLLQAGPTAGYDDGFILSSSDGNWLLRVNFLMQQRFIYNSIDVPPAGVGEEEDAIDEDRYGFENTRSTLILSGHVFNPSWFYRLDVNFGSNSVDNDDFVDDEFFPTSSNWGRTGTLRAYLGYDYGNGWRIKMGTMKLPLLREELVDSQYQLMVERSILNYYFTTGYGDGLAFEWNGDKVRVEGMFSDGAQTGQSIWSNGPFADFDVPSVIVFEHLPGRHADWALTGRAEFLASGSWDQFRDFTSPRSGEIGILVGAAVHYQEAEDIPGGGYVNDNLIATGDISLELGGAHMFAALVYADNDFGGPENWNPWGFLVQGGLYIDETWELFARFEWMDWDDDVFVGVDDLSVVTAGVNKYFAGHNAKWTTDFGWGFNPVFVPARITGWRNDNGADFDGQWVVRTQIQLFF